MTTEGMSEEVLARFEQWCTLHPDSMTGQLCREVRRLKKQLKRANEANEQTQEKIVLPLQADNAAMGAALEASHRLPDAHTCEQLDAVYTQGLKALSGEAGKELLAERDKLRALLKEYEWDGYFECRQCRGHKAEGHKPDCEWDKAANGG